MRHHHETIVELCPNHTNNMFHSSKLHSCSYQFHFTFVINHTTHATCQYYVNLSIPIHNTRNFIHIHMPHTLNRVNHPILQFVTIRGENSVACSDSRSSQEPSLRREECPRSSCRLSLRQDRDRGLGRFCERSLRRGHLA